METTTYILQHHCLPVSVTLYFRLVSIQSGSILLAYILHIFCFAFCLQAKRSVSLVSFIIRNDFLQGDLGFSFNLSVIREEILCCKVCCCVVQQFYYCVLSELSVSLSVQCWVNHWSIFNHKF